MHGPGRCRIPAQQQHWRQEGAAHAIAAPDVEMLRIAVNEFRFPPQFRNAREDLVALREACEWAHAHAFGAGITDDGLRQLRLQCTDDVGQAAAGHERLADRRAFLPGLHRHLARDFAHEQVELGRSRRSVRPEDRGVQRIGFGDEPHRMADHRRVRAQLRRRRRRTGERHHVLAIEVIEQVADATADQLQCPGRQQPGLDDAPYDELRQVTRRGRRLHQRGHARQQRRRQLFEHAPDRKVEGVDVYCRAFERDADVLADERSALRQGLDSAIQIDAAVRQFARPFAREHEHRADAAVDVDPGVGFRRACPIGEFVELVLEVEQPLAERAQHRGALVECHGAQRATAGRARVRERAADVESAARRLRHGLAGARIKQSARVTRSFLPAIRQVTLQAHAFSPVGRRLRRRSYGPPARPQTKIAA